MTYFKGVPRCVTKYDRGRGVKIGQKWRDVLYGRPLRVLAGVILWFRVDNLRVMEVQMVAKKPIKFGVQAADRSKDVVQRRSKGWRRVSSGTKVVASWKKLRTWKLYLAAQPTLILP